MTIAALRRLLEEIDHQGGPDAARHNRLNLPDPQETHMSQPVPQPPAVDVPGLVLPRPAGEPQQLPVGQLLKWGDDHVDPNVRDQAARARVLLTGLRRRHAADQELTAITTEAAELEKRLAELRAREAELAPAKPKRQRDYDPATVRAWAAENGVDCPDRGRVPKTVLDAWRDSLPQAG